MARTYSKNASNYTVYGTANKIATRLEGARQSSAFAWVKAASYNTATGNNCIMNVWLGATNNAILMDIDNTGASPTLRCGVRGSAADAKLSVNSVTPIPTGRWFSVGFIADYAAGTIRCYVNGRFEAAASGTLTTPFHTASTPTTADGIGAANSGTATQGTAFQWDGQIESPCLWKCNIGDAGMRRLHMGETPQTVYPTACIWWPYCGPEAGSKLIERSHFRDYLPITGSVPVATGHNGARVTKRNTSRRRTRNMTPDASASDAVVFSDSGTQNVYWGRTVNDTSAFADSATKVTYWNRTITDSFGTADSSPESEVDVRIILDSCAFLDVSVAVVPNASNAVIFVDGATGSRSVVVDVADSIVTDDSTSGYTGTSNIFNLTVAEGILFVDQINQVRLIDVEDSFTVVNLPGQVFTTSVTDSCAFTHDGERGSDREVSMNLAFNDVLTEQKISRPLDEDTFVFTDQTSWSVVHHSFLTDQVLFTDYSYESTGAGFAIGIGGQVIPKCDTYPTSLGIYTIFHMQYPVVLPTNTLDLRVPQFGNERHYTISTKIKRTMDGFPRVARPGTWPKIEKFNYTFMYLTATQREAFISFFDLTGGQLIKIVDQDNVAWQGVILDPKLSTEQVGPGCQFKLEFSFRGTKL